MNFLAHSYLSFGQPEILVGNMISDFVKGSLKFGYPSGIQKGIALHRAIDTFTDTHPYTRKAREVFIPSYRLYSGPIMDIVYDHFLASDESVFTEHSLKKYTQNIYVQLEAFSSEFPANFEMAFMYMKKENWLFNYRFISGIEKTFIGLIRRSSFLTDSVTVNSIFLDQYQHLKKCYESFFPDVKQFTKAYFENHLL